MNIGETDILIVPGYTGSGPEHWQTHWERKIATARRVQQEDWTKPHFNSWQGAVMAAVNAATRPVVLVAHSLGVITLVHAAHKLDKGRVKGAFLVAPPGKAYLIDHEDIDPKFADVPLDPLFFPSVLVASRSDPICPYHEAKEWAHGWGSAFSDSGDSGHINTDSGHGPWPEGLALFDDFLAKL